ncbi:MAG: hypothetical protein HY221_02605 [Candidatus Sungbacteria bacterium]|uniref:DUF4258 domain-containing protein n=1 Tax=Candidatus Sungiibacteriota bacterium TaxID=2750080 RepID=A0A932QYJ4_9BACT|nr:hypothetical protein [Candidatus Sungbacteria bacterium]
MPAAERYVWTHHVRQKLRHYRLTESRVKRIIRRPARIEEGIVEGAVACMQPAGGRRYAEIWTLYVLSGTRNKQVKVISAWRYPGQSPKRDPIPSDILKEIQLLV